MIERASVSDCGNGTYTFKVHSLSLDDAGLFACMKQLHTGYRYWSITILGKYTGRYV